MMKAESPEVILRLDTSVYRLTAIKKAAYRLGHRCFVQIRMTSVNEAEVLLQCKDLHADLDQLTGDFTNEVLDQELRELVAEETVGIRNLLMAQAFSATNLTDATGETADYRTDPLQIREPGQSG